jgi:hypothetical protein
MTKAQRLIRMAIDAKNGDTSAWPPSPEFVLEAFHECFDFESGYGLGVIEEKIMNDFQKGINDEQV